VDSEFLLLGVEPVHHPADAGLASLAEGQKGVVFRRRMKLLIPFVIVFPGIMPFNLYSNEMAGAASNDTTDYRVIWQEYEQLNACARDHAVHGLRGRCSGLQANRPEQAATIEARYNARVRDAATPAP
jgi:hypothetical protein